MGTKNVMIEQHFCNGKWIEGTGERIAVINPCTEQPIGYFNEASADLVDEAVRAAGNAFPAWSALSGSERAAYMRKMTAAIRDHMDDLVTMQIANCGKPRSEAEADIIGSVDCIDYFADRAEEMDARQQTPIDYDIPGYRSATRLEPMGPVGFILPWNFPMKICSWKLGPALAAGCTVVIKPSEITPFTDTFWGKAAELAGLPAGVLNVVNGRGAITGSALAEHPGLRKISFTGSTRTGKSIMKAAAEDVKNIGLELGGKSPILVFEDADLDLAARLAAEGVFYNAGQCCNATCRLLVHESVKAPLAEKIVALCEAEVLGTPDTPDMTMGPLASSAQFDKVTGYQDIAREEGLHCCTGGNRASGFNTGYFVEPTLYTDVPKSSRLWNEEIFGPILCMRTFADEDEAIAEANDTEYGLAATIVSENEQRVQRVAARLEAGHVYANVSVAIPPQTSWGGFKQSGIGRELGPWGLAGFLEVKTVTSRK
jgi:betaine-aldehyde dehydrogenase